MNDNNKNDFIKNGYLKFENLLNKKECKNFLDKTNKIKSYKIDIVEIGFRFLKKNKYQGKFSFISDKDIKKLKISSRIKIAVMINAFDILEHAKKRSQTETVKYFLNLKKLSRISIVRVATHFKEVKDILPFIKIIKKLGYQTVLNLMQSSDKNISIFQEVISHIKKSKSVDILYFADSLGCMNPKNVKDICGYIKKPWKKSFGFHSHDNMSNALVNTITAHKYGAKWLDSTVQGMGRGAGNVKTESLILNFYRNDLKNQDLEQLYYISEKIFKKIKNRYKWGYSPYYHFAAIKRLHPTYVQSILEENKYSDREIIQFLLALKELNSSSFDKNYILKLFDDIQNFKKCTDVSNYFNNKNILIISQGKSIYNNKNKINNFLKKNKVTVLSLNINKQISYKHIDYYLACNPERIILDFPFYKKLKKSLVIPKKYILNLKKISKYKKIIDFGLNIRKDSLKSYNKYCDSFTNLVFAYALCFAVAGNCNKIYLAGFDGYDDINKNKPNQDIINLFKQNYPKKKLQFITKSPYRL